MLKEVVIHIGIHKTASSFLQKKFFPLYKEKAGYINLRKQLPDFINYILYCSHFEYVKENAASIFFSSLKKFELSSQRITISDEQFCGSPWQNADWRKEYFDRLNDIFPSAKYIIVLRNQEDIVQSLYLQYIKTGGSATWKEFLAHRRHPLNFALKSYLNYGPYIKYMVSKVGANRIGCFFYEDMKIDPSAFLARIGHFIGFDPGDGLKKIITSKENPSISPFWAHILRHINKFCRSERQPFLIIPKRIHFLFIFLLLKLSFSHKRNKIIPQSEVLLFCSEPKKNNFMIKDIFSRDISQLGY